MDGGSAAEPDGDRADVLAVVAPVDPVADHGAPLVAGSMPGFWRIHDRHRRPSITPGATMAPVGQPSRHSRHVPHPSATDGVGGLVVRRGDDRSQDEPAADAGEEQVGVLAVPAETGAVRHGAVDDRVVVGERDGTVVGAPDRLRDVDAARHAAGRSDRPRRTARHGPGACRRRRLGSCVGQIGTGGDDDRRQRVRPPVTGRSNVPDCGT